MAKAENVIICPPCGESVAVATKEGQNRKNALWPLLPRLTAVLPPQGREMVTYGFTLIELLVVVLIIGILAAVAVPQYQKAVEKSKATQALALMKTMVQAAKVYELAKGKYPTSFNELDVSLAQWTGKTVFYQGTDAISNGEWAMTMRIENKWEGILIGKISGKYKGAGFRYTYSKTAPNKYRDKIQCIEIVGAGSPIFELNAGDYCVKIMNGSFVDKSNARRVYDLP